MLKWISCSCREKTLSCRQDTTSLWKWKDQSSSPSYIQIEVLLSCWATGFKLGLYQIQTLEQSVGHYMNRNWTLSQSFSVPTWANNCSQWRALTRPLQPVWAWSSPWTQTQHKPGGKCCATELTLNLSCPLNRNTTIKSICILPLVPYLNCVIKTNCSWSCISDWLHFFHCLILFSFYSYFFTKFITG